MKISQKAEYALRAIFDLSLQPPGELVKVSCIAARQEIPRKFLELILANLRQGNFVETRRGREGGYRLARSADKITVGEVLVFVEGWGNGKRPANGAFTEMWSRIDDFISTVLGHTTFADLALNWQKNAAEADSAYRAWNHSGLSSDQAMPLAMEQVFRRDSAE